MEIEMMKAKLADARYWLEQAEKAKARAELMSETAHEMGGGIPGFGGSGNQRAAQKVRGAWTSADRAHREADERIELWSYKIRSLERRIAEAERVRYTADDLKGATHVKYGSWRKVVRVSTKSVTVESGYSWTDRVPIEQITDFRILAAESE
jgi:hypothetical protein